MAKSKSRWLRFVGWVNKYIRSFKNFYKSSFLSLLIIIIILLLLTQMDQALTMMVDLIERDRFSLFLAFFFINALAIALSHFPIYNYYAANLNNSANYTEWHTSKPIRFWPFTKFPVYIFTTNKDVGYKPDNRANYLRYALGVLIYAVWIHYIISSFAPNLYFEDFPITLIKWICYPMLLVPFLLYIYYKRKTTRLAKAGDEEALTALYKRLGLWYFLIAFTTLMLMLITILVGNFSPASFVLLLLTGYFFMLNYLFFRLLRTKLTRIKKTLTSPLLLPASIFIGRFLYLERSENYITMFFGNFVIATGVLVYATVGSIKGWPLSNGIPILLAFFYFYYFIIASLGKYFFVTKKLGLFQSKKYKFIFVALAIWIILILITQFGGVENTTHELDQVPAPQNSISEARFLESIRQKEDETLFFIASHGGGLKANVWTLNVLNTLQEKTNGQLLNRTIAFSGASGGSLGLALYSGLYGLDGTDTEAIQKKIDLISEQNYTSVDLSLTFGLDTYRKLWPFSQRIGVRDRPYYAMIKYQNCVEGSENKTLSEVPFRTYWKNGFDSQQYMPSLIMNTAETGGNRGILWSVDPQNFNSIFPYAVDLAELDGGKTLPFYQAVSTTNRFPVFSPAAKIKGYGHFIDAGAIDNSGLLGCLDLYNYLNRNSDVLQGKLVVFVEIINSKGLYTNFLKQEFMQEAQIAHIPIDEQETDNIAADLQTGLNLDKIPRYLSDFLSNLELLSAESFRHFEIYMPHKVLVEDVEGILGGKIIDDEIRASLGAYLKRRNDNILAITDLRSSFFQNWEYYEPTLSRHLSKSSINYIKKIMDYRDLQETFETINTLVNPEKVEPIIQLPPE